MAQKLQRMLLLSLLFGVNVSIADTYKGPKDGFPEDAVFAEPDFVKKLFEAEGKKQVVVKTPDVKITLGGIAKVETTFAKNLTLLNGSLPDEYGFIRQTYDFTTDVAVGEEKYGHKAIELFTNMRHRSIFGNVGKSNTVTSETVKLDGIDVVTGKHNHIASQPLLWFRDAWLQVSLNALIGYKDKTVQYFKIGLFPFWLGRGISLGTIYGGGKEFLGIYSGYQNDVSAPGMMLYGDIFKNILSYNAYYAKLEEKSDSFKETLNGIKANHVGHAATPWRGVDKDNDLFAFRLQWKMCNDPEGNNLTWEPYVLYNYASDRKVEFEGDSRSKLGTTGLGFEYSNDNIAFECGAEAAINFGNEHLYHIDRNNVQLTRDANGNLITVFSHVLDTQGNKAVVTSASKTILKNNKDFINNEPLTGSNDTLFNASDRYRPAYTNRYAGYMAVADAAYTIKAIDLKWAVGGGIASGDKNPHRKNHEHDKTYNGFVGLQEAYSGNRVPSLIVLDARKLKRPLSLDYNTPFIEDDPSFTDIQYVGTGLTWFPIEHRESKFFLSSNALIYWKFKKSHKFDLTTNKPSTTELASKFFGTEWNARIKYEILNNLYVYGDFAIFFPGQFYHDVQGTPLKDDVFKTLNLPDDSGIDPTIYRLSHDTAYYLNLGMTYRF